MWKLLKNKIKIKFKNIKRPWISSLTPELHSPGRRGWAHSLSNEYAVDQCSDPLLKLKGDWNRYQSLHCTSACIPCFQRLPRWTGYFSSQCHSSKAIIKYYLVVMPQIKSNHYLLQHIFPNLLFPEKGLRQQLSKFVGLPCPLTLSRHTALPIRQFLNKIEILL